MATADQLSLFERVLLATDGTVTDLIALYAGETIRVTKLAQTIGEDLANPALQCDGHTRLINRTILLRGSSRIFLHADSQFVVDRLPASIRQKMLETDRPIGLLWKEERLETFREIIAQAVEPTPSIAAHFCLPASSPFVSRTYLIYHHARPMGVITERWPVDHFR